MFFLFLSIVIAFIAWTFFALMSKGVKDSEIKAVLRSLTFNLRSTLIDFKSLFFLLLKDAFQPTVTQGPGVLDDEATIDILPVDPELGLKNAENSTHLKNITDYSLDISSMASTNDIVNLGKSETNYEKVA